MANEYIAKDYLGGVASTTLTTGVSGSALSLIVASGTTYPDGTNGPFVVVLDRGTGVEEKVICSSRSGNTLTVLQRGYDGTTGQAHSIGATVEHALDAYSIKQVNTLANTWTTRGDLLYRNASGNPARLGVGAAGTVLKGGTDPAYGTIGNAEVDAAAAIALSKLAAGTSAQVIVGNASGVPTYRTLTGDVTISDTGVTTIGNNTVAPANLTTATAGQLIVADSVGVPTYRTITGDVTISDTGVTAVAANSLVAGDFATSLNRVYAVADTTALAALTNLREGDFASVASDNTVRWYDGAAWTIFAVPTTSYTPTLAGMAIGTGGGATNIAHYAYANGVLVLTGIILFGTAGATFPTSPSITLPAGFTAAASVTPNYATVGQAIHLCSGVAYHGYMAQVSSTQIRPLLYATGGTYAGSANLVAGTVPVAWVAGDIIRYSAYIPGTLV